MIRLFEVKNTDHFEIAYKCKCGALFTADVDDMYIDTEVGGLDGYVAMTCPECNEKIKIYSGLLPKEVVSELVDKYFDQCILSRKKEK